MLLAPGIHHLAFILLPFLDDDSWWRLLNVLPLIGFRTTEACLAAFVSGLAFLGMLTLIAPL